VVRRSNSSDLVYIQASDDILQAITVVMMRVERQELRDSRDSTAEDLLEQ